jgi:hypothetical protein
VKKLTRALRENGVQPEPGVGPFIPSKETARRYGIALPGEVRHLFEIADTWALEDVAWKNATYLRAAPAGWEVPSADVDELFATFWQRFEWNVFGNMQLWEHLAGVVCIATHESDGRFYAAMFETDGGDAPVFYMDHETAALVGCVAPCVSSFLRVQMKDDDVPARERKLVAKPEPWDREHGSTYLPAAASQPLHEWPPFLACRSEWIIAALCFGAREAAVHLKKPEVTHFDAKNELARLATSAPLALYWLLRAFLLEESDVFGEAEKQAKTNPSPLVQSVAKATRLRWSSRDPKSSLVARRKEVAKLALPRKAKRSLR